MGIYKTIFNRLIAIGIIDKEGNPKFEDHMKLKSCGFMDLNIDFLYKDKMYYTIAMAHNYLQNGDVMADPDMEVKVMPEMKLAEALTFKQDGGLPIFQQVYEQVDGQIMVYPQLQRDLNRFLSGWLLNIKRQGFKNL